MKSLVEFINESHITEGKINYILTWYKEGVGVDYTYISSPDDRRRVSDALYYDIFKYNATDNTDVSQLVGWGNKGDKPYGYWAHVLYNSENPDKADKNATILKGRKLEQLKKKRNPYFK